MREDRGESDLNLLQSDMNIIGKSRCQGVYFQFEEGVLMEMSLIVSAVEKYRKRTGL